MTGISRHRSSRNRNATARLRCSALTLLAVCLVLPGSACPAGRLYKWVDDNGQVRYGDRLPPEHARKRNQILNNQGIVVETNAAQKTPEQLEEEQRLAAVKAQEERERRERARKDRILLDTFTNEDEMVMTRDGKIEAIEAIIRVTRGRISRSRERLSELTRQAADLERAGHAVPPGLTRQIAESHGQIQQNLNYIETRRNEQQAIREIFERDIKRFRELKMAEAQAQAEKD